MKYFLIIASAVLLSACSVKKSKTSTDTSKEVEVAAQAPKAIVVDDGLTKVAETFAKAVIDINPGLLNQFAPTTSLARFLSPTATATMSDEQIEKEMLLDLKTVFELNLEKIQTAIESNNVDRATFKYESYNYYETEDPVTSPRVLEVNFLNGNNEVHVPITVLKHEGKWYVFEILNTTNLFKTD